MEHRLIRGGEQYLAFARSRVNALKNLGAPFANQCYDLGDATVRVRVEPGHEFINIDGNGITLKMDSGAVTYTYLAPLSASRTFPGYLFDCGPAVTYHAGFLARINELGVEEFGRTKPSEDSIGQIAGDVTVTTAKGKEFRGRIVYDTDMEAACPSPIPGVNVPANCLSPTWVVTIVNEETGEFEKTPVGVPPEEGSYGDGLLAQKKLTMTNCPASIFTGKTRLYVQAMYGLPLYEYVSIKPGEKRTKTRKRPFNTPPGLVMTGLAPWLKVKAYVAPDDFKPGTRELNEYPPVDVTTDCGIRLDPYTGKHFMIIIGGGNTATNVVITPLVAKDNINPLRRYLVTQGEHVPTKPLSGEDREHLEAYILARSLPDAKNAISLPAMGPSGYYSLGYGWHWNWSGTTADIVVNKIVKFDWSETKNHMRSTHYRVNVNIDTEILTNSTATLTTVTPASDWYVERGWFPIVEPDYSVDYLFKATPGQTWAIDGTSAPFYAFYRRDELVVCTIENKFHAAENTREMSGGFATSPAYGGVIERIVPYGGTGWLKDTQKGEHRTTTFTIGGVSTGELILSRLDYVYEIHAGCQDGGIVYGPMWNDTSTASTVTIGGVPYTPAPGEYFIVNNGYYRHMTWWTDQWNATDSYSSSAEIVVPFFDSQAIYLDWATHKRAVFVNGHRYATNQSSETYYPGWTSVTRLWDGNTGALITEYLATSPAEVPSTTVGGTAVTEPRPDEDVDTRTLKLVCVAGVVDHDEITTGHQYFHVNLEDYVESQFDTRSGTSVADPTVVAEQAGVMVGSHMPWFASTVGWV